MKVTLGKKGLYKSWQAKFTEDVSCCHCGGVAHIGFVAHEGIDDDDAPILPRRHVQFVADLHDNKGVGGYWPQDCVAVAVYFCRDCLKTTATYNQA